MWTKDYEEIVAWKETSYVTSITTLSYTSKGDKWYKVYTLNGLSFDYQIHEKW